MIPDPDERRVMQRLHPGVLCRDGFLGADDRPLGEILESDLATVQRMGVTHERIAAAMGAACEAARAGLGTEVSLAGGRLEAVCREAMGYIASPWGDGKRFPKGQVEVVELATGRRLVYTPLTVYLIGAYGFYGGRGSPYRVEPAEAVRMFGLESAAR